MLLKVPEAAMEWLGQGGTLKIIPKVPTPLPWEGTLSTRPGGSKKTTTKLSIWVGGMFADKCPYTARNSFSRAAHF